MNVEDSYEGAVRRLQRLGLAGAPPPDEGASQSRDALRARVHDLEELATLACDENEQLQRELTEARDQVATLQRLFAMREEGASEASLDDESFEVVRTRRPVLAAVVAAALGGLASAALFTLRPWERTPSAVAAVAAPAPLIQPAAAPPPAAIVAPPPPTVAPPASGRCARRGSRRARA